MDVLFNPSITETFGNVTLEAMACGVPVVAAGATGSTSLVEDGVRARWSAAGDVAGYADAIAPTSPTRPARAPRRGGRGAQPRLHVGRDQPGGGRHLPPAGRGQKRELAQHARARACGGRTTTAAAIAPRITSGMSSPCASSDAGRSSVNW